MNLQLKAWQVQLRVSTGTFILNSGLAKVRGDEAAAKQTHGFAVGAYPVLRRLDPSLFVGALSAGEIALGTARLVPVVPSALVGTALTAFSGALLGLYLRTPDLRQEGAPVSIPRDRSAPPARSPRRPVQPTAEVFWVCVVRADEMHKEETA